MIKHIFFTDGACSGNPGPGGYGVIELSTCLRETIDNYIESYSLNYEYSESFEHTTNNRMELMAILHVLKIAAEHPGEDYIICSDSAYAVNSINNWIRGWAAKGWVNSKKVTVENVDLMQEIYKYIDLDNYTLKKVSGHSGELGNELADAAATGNGKKRDDLINKYHILINWQPLPQMDYTKWR